MARQEGILKKGKKTLKKKGVCVCQMPTRELTRGYVLGDYVARVVLPESGGMG